MSKVDQKEVAAIRAAIREFLDERKQKKLELIQKDYDAKKLTQTEFESSLQELEDRFALDAWVADAARRAAQIRLATHIAKPTHPESGADSLFVDSKFNSDRYIGSDATAGLLDVVGNAAALDVYGMLRIVVAGRSILERIRSVEPAAHAAFGPNGLTLVAAFAELFAAPTAPKSHTRAKQIYFPVGAGHNLLGPVYPSTLANVLHAQLQIDRFGDVAKASRESRKNEAHSPAGFAEYPGLAVQMFGSGKPQNISRLTQDRMGQGLLLPSLPPTWRHETSSAPLRSISIFRGPYSPRVRGEVKRLTDFLKSTDYNNVNIRNHRQSLVDELVDELLVFGAEMQSLASGWSSSSTCELIVEERYWLDSGRANTDMAFGERRQLVDWQAAVALGFAKWLNFELKRAGLPVGDAEQFEWQRQVEEELNMAGDPLDNVDGSAGVGDAA